MSASGEPAGTARRLLAFFLASLTLCALSGLFAADAQLLRLAWCAALAVPLGAACGSAARSAREAFWLGGGAWCGAGLALALGGPAQGVGLLSALWPLGALGLAGLGLGRLLPGAAVPGACVLSLTLSGLPTGFGLFAASPGESSPRVGALLVDLSPAALVVETAGGDWMRAPGIYDPAGTEWFSDRRAPYPVLWGPGGPSAAFARAGPKSLVTPLLGVVGCALVLGSRRRGRPTPP